MAPRVLAYIRLYISKAISPRKYVWTLQAESTAECCGISIGSANISTSSVMFVLFLFLFLTTIAYTSPLFERKIFDPYIICHNPPPPAYALPSGYSSQNYPNSMDLCSAANGQRSQNVGCFCSSAYSDLHCDSDLADATLAKAATPFFNPSDEPESFLEFCELACYCADTKSATLARNSLQRNSQLNRVLNDHYDPFSFTSDDDTANLISYNNQCGSNCSTNIDCAGGQNGCKCKTQSEQYVPGKGMVMFAAACIISLRGKREEQMPCPCNGTYVSHACCEVLDGTVQEPERFKLGELLKPDEF